MFLVNTILLLVVLEQIALSFCRDEKGNIFVLKNEIDKALKDCDNIQKSGEHGQKASGTSRPEATPSPVKYSAGDGDGERRAAAPEMPPPSGRKELREVREKRQEESDENDDNWDYDGSKALSVDRTRSAVDFGNKRLPMNGVYNSTGNATYFDNRDKSIRNDNFTKYDKNPDSNNFDSRGGGIRSPASASSSEGFGKLSDERAHRSMMDLNQTDNFYDPFMTRGIRSVNYRNNSRKKRYQSLTKTVNEDECLSQCIFTNLQIVDERGIPKEAMFTKLLQESVTSQQSRIMLEEQVKNCFRELAGESEDNGCLYSNALDRCMKLEVRKRKSILLTESDD